MSEIEKAALGLLILDMLFLAWNVLLHVRIDDLEKRIK